MDRGRLSDSFDAWRSDFAPALQDNDLGLDRLRSLIAPPGTPGVASVPEEIIQAFPELVAVSRRFLADVFQETPWSDYDLVGFSTMFTIAPALALAKLVKTLRTPPPVILGGSYCEDEMGEQLLRSFPFLDFVCRGEGERLIVELAAHLSGNRGRFDDIRGLLWRDGAGQVHINAPGRLYPGKATLAASGVGPAQAKNEPHHQLDELPVPTYGDWLQQVRRRQLRTVKQIRLPIQTSRGCWYGEKHHCTFCGLNDATIGYRSKSPERVVHEFRELMKLDVTAVDCVDDILDFRYFATVLPELAKLRHGLEILLQIKANLSHAQVALLKEAGIVWLQPGIESLCTPLLQLMDKGVTAFQNVRLLRYASELGVGIAWNLLYGFPGEDPKWFEDMAKLVPALSHLEPPFIDCSHIRLHRFSPLFVNSNSAGLRDVRPCPSYFEFYPFDTDVVARMAYYFEHDYVSQPEPDSYIGGLSETVKRWHEEVGVAAFLSVDESDAVYLIDTRRLASVPRAVLRGLEREVFQACVHGAKAEALPSLLSRDANEVLRVIELFKERHWVSRAGWQSPDPRCSNGSAGKTVAPIPTLVPA